MVADLAYVGPGNAAPSDEHLHLAVERHEAGFHAELVVALSNLFTELPKSRPMRFRLYLRICNFGFPIGNLGSAAIAMVDCDHLLDAMQLDRCGEIVPKCLVPILECRIAAPAMTNWLNFPVKFCSTVYLCTGSCIRGSMQARTIAS